jgi:hypothetical protein
MPARPPLRAALTVEGLEERSLPSSAPLLIEPFQTATATGLPAGWAQWAGNGQVVYHAGGTTGLGGPGELVSVAPSGVAARAWIKAPFSADIAATAAVYLNSLDPTRLFVRGRNLDTAAPTYYAVSIVRGTEVQLVRVMGGRETVIGATRSGDYVSNMWVQVTVQVVSNELTVQVRRTDTGKYLSATGDWSSEPVNAIDVLDSGIASAGQVGFARGTQTADPLVVDNLYVNQVYPESRSVYQVERFDTETGGALPDGWGSWSTGNNGSAVTTPDQLLKVGGTSGTATRLWINRVEPADIQVTSSVFLDSLVPTQLFARGAGVDTARPTYYAVSVTRGLTVQLLRVVNGQQTVLGSLRAAGYVSSQWIQVSMVVKGNELRAQVFRTDTGQYLQSNGTWGLAPAWALVRTDGAITRAGYTGLGRGAGGTDAVTFDNFVVSSAPVRWDETSPIPTQYDKPTPLPPPPDGSGPSPTPAPSPPPPAPPPPPGKGTGSTTLPTVPQHLSWIRLAELAYYGTPLDATEQALLRKDVDLVIPNAAYMSQIASVSPGTPQFLYSNVSNIYLNLLTDWLQYADQNHIDREAAFYHVTRPTSYSGMSASAVPVNQFWGVYSQTGTRATDLTSAAHAGTSPFALGGSGSTLAVGYTELFREIDVSLQSSAAAGWGGQWQYVTAVDAKGNPTAWARLDLLQDGTGGMRRSGAVTFDPPANWVTASIDGSARLYYVRFVTTSGGVAPVVRTLLGADYTNSRGTAGGTIPVFDYAAAGGKDYLTAAEYAKRKPGDNAWFAYQSRVFYPSYGPNRFATNVSDPAFRAWAVNYEDRLLAASPLAAGVFIDNSVGKLAIDPSTVRESMADYSAAYGTLLGAIDKSLGTKWVIANTGGGGSSADPVVANGVSYLEEFALRPMSANAVQFQDLAATLAARQQLGGGKVYDILDSLPTAGYDANDPRVQLTTLAMYYLLADPKYSFLMMNGGNEPSSDWSRHFTAAIDFNVGKPLATWSVFATGTDPTNASLSYTVFSRTYQNALVLYKPVAYSHGVNGQTGDATATTQYLGGRYREVLANGTLGPVITKISLRNGDGVILAKA